LDIGIYLGFCNIGSIGIFQVVIGGKIDGSSEKKAISFAQPQTQNPPETFRTFAGKLQTVPES